MTQPVLPPVEDASRNALLIDVGDEFVDNLTALLAGGQQGMVLNIVADLHPADVSRLLAHLPFDEAQRLFDWLPVELRGEVLSELDTGLRTDLLAETHPTVIGELLDTLDTDDAADVLGELPDEIAREVLPSLADAEDVEELMGYSTDTAGGIMGTEFVAVPRTMTVAEATEEVRRMAEVLEHIFVVYVTDDRGRLEGFVTLKRLLLSPSDTRMEAVLRTDHVSVPTDMDQEEVARIMERYDLYALPVVDAQERLVGRITIDDVVDVIREEAEEDYQRLSGLSGDEEVSTDTMQVVRGRLPWLLTGLAGAGLSALVIGAFEHALQQAVVLATFIPIVMATAGNAGIQSAAITVQGLAAGDVWASDILRRLGKEFFVSAINGVALAAVLGVGVLLLAGGPGVADLALTASLCLVVVTILATTIGATVPLVLYRMNIDPAMATGPFITTSNDILGILVFFLLATWLYLG